MSKICESCGKKPGSGNNVSYSQRKTRRRFLPNIMVKKIWVAATKMFVTCKLCTRCIRTLAKKI